MKNNIKDVFLDLDHTLWDFDKNSNLAFGIILKKNNVIVDLQCFVEVYNPINLGYWKLHRDGKITKDAMRYGRLKDSFMALNIEVNDVVIHKLAKDYITYLTTYNYLIEDAVAILNYLEPKYNLHIITNGFKSVQETKLKKAKISHYFKTLTSSESVGVKKPNAKVFNYALKVANASKETSIMIGDNIEADVIGALNCGMDAICFNYHNVILDNKIKSITRLLEIKNYL